MLSSLLIVTLLTQLTGQGQIRQDILLNKDGSQPRLMMRQPQDPLQPAKKGPKTFGENKIPFEFDWITWGFVKSGTGEEHELRFRVYSQERKAENDAAFNVTRMMLRLWDFNKQRLGIDHAPRQPDGYRLVNVYVTWGGRAGGEQFTSAETEANKRVTSNTIYFYDLASFTDPLEMAREVAHEYGHATLPAIGTYKAPEDWANGYLGEKLYLLWIRDILAKDILHPDDFMGVKKEQLDGWIGKQVDPLILKAASKAPTMGELADRSAAGMDAYLGLALYMSQILPDKAFSKSIKIIGSQNARDYPGAITEVLSQADETTLNVPASLKGREIWIPAGKGRVTGAKVLAIEGGWAKILPGSDSVTIRSKGE
jgi:hypothetical protein